MVWPDARRKDALDDAGRRGAFQQKAAGDRVRDIVRHGHEAVRRDIAFLRVGAAVAIEGPAHSNIGDAVAGLPCARLRASLNHHAGRLVAENDGHGHGFRLVEAAAAHVHIGEIERNGRVAHAHLIWRGWG
jgi:hypothetical protein